MNSLRYSGIRSPHLLLRRRPFLHHKALHPASRRYSLLSASTALIYEVHSFTGLPWVCTIPLTAFLVRMVVAFPLQVYTRIQASKERDLFPLLEAHKTVYRMVAGHGRVRRSPAEATKMVNRRMRITRELLYRTWKVPNYYRALNFVQLPVWIMLMESLRAMCGTSNGLVPYLLSFTRFGQDYTPPPIEHSLASEGALWFPNLLAGDPTGVVLPGLLTTSILLNVHLGWKVTPASDLADLPRRELILNSAFRVLRLVVQFLAFNVGVSAAFYDMPCALMIYWLASTNTATLQTFFLEKYVFPVRPLKPWKKVYIGFRNGARGTRPPTIPVSTKKMQ